MFAMLLCVAAFTACGDDDAEDVYDPNANLVLNQWEVKDGAGFFNYVQYDQALEKNVYHRMRFDFSNQDVCQTATDEIQFMTAEDNNLYLSLHHDYASFMETGCRGTLTVFVGHTKAEIADVLAKGDYSGSTLTPIQEPDPTPLYKEEDLYGTWAQIRSYGKYTDPDDFTGHVFVSEYDYEATEDRWMYEFREDGTVTLWRSHYPEQAETYEYSFNQYATNNYGISVNKGKVWHKIVRSLTENRLVLYQEKTLFYNLGYTETFERIK